MALQKNRLALIGAFVALCLIQSVVALNKFERITNIYEKLEKFFADKTNEIGVGKLDLIEGSMKDEEIKKIDRTELEEASTDYATWPANEKNGVLRSVPFRIVRDFVLAPLQREKTPSTKRILINYYKFRKAYTDGLRVWNDYKTMDGSTEKLYEKIIGNSAEPLELKDFENAKRESLNLLDDLNTLAALGLMHEKKNDFVDYLNFFNHRPLKALFIFVFPAMKYIRDVSALKSLYLEKMFLFGYKYVDSKLTSNQQLLDHPGFQYVV